MISTASSFRLPQTEPATNQKRDQLSNFRKLCDPSLLRDGCFLSYLITTILWNGTYYIPYTFIPDRAQSYGISRGKSAFLISITGISNTIGRLLFGAINDLEWVRPQRVYLYMASFMICGIATAASSVSTFIAQCAYAAAFGFFLGKFLMGFLL